MFLIVGLVIALTLGAIFIASFKDEIVKDFKKGCLIVAGILTVCFIISGLFVGHYNFQHSEYNNGQCKECGGEYELFDIEHVKYTKRYYYKCERCDNILKLNYEFEKSVDK